MLRAVLLATFAPNFCESLSQRVKPVEDTLLKYDSLINKRNVKRPTSIYEAIFGKSSEVEDF